MLARLREVINSERISIEDSKLKNQYAWRNLRHCLIRARAGTRVRASSGEGQKVRLAAGSSGSCRTWRLLRPALACAALRSHCKCGQRNVWP